MLYMDTMGKRIKERRKQLNLTMEQVGTYCGVQKSAVNKWEKDKVETLKPTVILKICEVLKCEPLWLMYGYDPTNEPEELELTDTEKILIKAFRKSPHQDAILSLLGIQKSV